MKKQTMHRFCEGKIIHWVVVLFWTTFWFLNVLDKFIGGKTFLFVGKDRLAQFLKFFSSLGIQDPTIAIGSLIIGTFLEVAAFVFLLFSIIYLIKKREEVARKMFFWGTLIGLVLFSYFAIGDQIFGDRFELLEHTIFWVAILMSWYVYRSLPENIERNKKHAFVFSNELIMPLVITAIVGLFSGAFVGVESIKLLDEQKTFVQPELLSEGMYKFDLPFLANRGVFEESIKQFESTHPNESIINIYTAPDQLKSKADNAVIYIITSQK